MKLKELRLSKAFTQKQCADFIGVPLRTYIRYENDPLREGTVKYRYMIDKLTGLNSDGEGILNLEYICERCHDVFQSYEVEYCYLFGSYAKGKARADSDVDLFVVTDTKGLRFFGMVEELRQALGKSVDVLGQEQLDGNADLAREILRDGVKIYG